jgi:hypothetical protein
MIEVCPRCSSRLGSPLKSGRLVCASCGWSADPVPSREIAQSAKTKQSPVVDILTLCWRIVRRTFVFVVQTIQDRIQSFRQVESKEIVQGLSARLSALEKSIPTAGAETPRWMSLEDAFRYLGGDPNDPNSVVKTLNGSASFPLRRFRTFKKPADFVAFGLEADLERRDHNKPWLRWTD